MHKRPRDYTSRKLREQERRILLDRIKAAPCADCYQTYPPERMDFDHVRGVKAFDIATHYTHALAKLLAEIDKCDIVCSNCHRTRSKTRRSLRRST